MLQLEKVRHSGIPSLNVCMNCHKNIAEYTGEEDLREWIHQRILYEGD